MVVGIAGKYATGKSTVAAVLEEHGFLHLDVDKLGHSALERRAGAVIARFGDEVAAPDPVTIDRKALGRIVFSDSAALRDLESIVHPEMVQMVREFIANHANRDIAINAAILFRMGLHSMCDAILVVTAPVPIRFFRALRRDRLPVRQLVGRLRSQANGGNEPQSSTRNADIIRVSNALGVKRLRRNIERILIRLRE